MNLDGRSGKKIAIIGKNGCGKSTFLKVLLGEVAPDRGQVIAVNETIGYLPQEIAFPPEFTLVGEYLESQLAEAWEQYKIDIALQQLQIAPEFMIKELQHLSGGERVKVRLVDLLLQEPTMLLFDEPTNNLDSETVLWLQKFMQEFMGTIVFVSHDRAFINAVSSTIWEFDHETHSIRAYGGDFDFFWTERQRRIEQQRQQHEAQFKEIVALEKWLTANEFHPKYRFSDRVLSKKQALENLQKNLVPKPQAEPKIRLISPASAVEGLLMKVSISRKPLPEKDILRNVQLSIHNDDRILITGANGVGKTTLLNILAGEERDFEGMLESKPNLRLGYLKQFSHYAKEVTVLETFLRETYTTETEARSVLANYLFTTEFMSSKLQSLSQGELRRLHLAIILTNQPDILFLDEPTNHLDIFSKATLEHFIAQLQIPLVIVSHDRYFIEKIAMTNEYHIS